MLNGKKNKDMDLPLAHNFNFYEISDIGECFHFFFKDKHLHYKKPKKAPSPIEYKGKKRRAYPVHPQPNMP